MNASRESPAAYWRRTWLIWLIQLVTYAALASVLPPLDDEVYYWSWSQSLQLSYFDHPGMVAWLIWLATRVFGDTVLGMRFPACCCLTFVFAVICFLVTRAPQSPPTASAGTLLRSVAKSHVHFIMIGVLLTPLFTFGAIVITPDAPLLSAWAAYCLWLIVIQEKLADASRARNHWRDWLLGGVILGLGGLSKYTMVLAVPAGFASFLLSGISWRKWLAGYLGHGVVSMIVASPILLYNVQHNFEPLLFQWRHAMHDQPASLQSFGEFWAVQWLLFGSLPLFLAPWTTRQLLSRDLSPHLRVCMCLYLLPLCFFVYKAAKTELEGNWALVMFVSVWPVAAAWYDTIRASRFWRAMTTAAFLPPAVCVVGLAVLLFSPFPILPAKADRLNRQRGRWETVQQIAQSIQARGEAIPTFTATYQMTALLRFWGVDARQEANFRASHYSFPPQHLADVPAAYVVTDRALLPEMTRGFGLPEHLGTFPIIVRGETAGQYSLWKYEKR